MTTAASFRSVTESGRAGAPGFEPGIAGPKPAALPLGYAPPEDSVTANFEGATAAERDGGRAGKAGTTLTVGAARRRLSTWLRPTRRQRNRQFRRGHVRGARRRPRRQSRHDLEGRGRQTAPQHLATPHQKTAQPPISNGPRARSQTAAAPAKPPRP